MCTFASGEVQYEFTLHFSVSILVIEGVKVCLLCEFQVKICNCKSVCESLELLGLIISSCKLYYVHSPHLIQMRESQAQFYCNWFMISLP
jgi:hypothetical protein